jgi:lactoylglutathione lyase
MRVGYVVLYVNDVDACSKFWTEKFDMAVREKMQVGVDTVVRVGFTDQNFSLELVPLSMMKDNPDGLDLASPSMCFYVDNLAEEHNKLSQRSVEVTELMEHFETKNFAFSDNEGRWFAVVEGK